jgi:hypothetical protein
LASYFPDLRFQRLYLVLSSPLHPYIQFSLSHVRLISHWISKKSLHLWSEINSASTYHYDFV